MVHSDGRVCYIRRSVDSFLNQTNPEAELMYLKPDKSIDAELMEDNAGLLKLRISIIDPRVKSDFTGTVWGKPLSRPKFKEGVLMANIYYVYYLIRKEGKKILFFRL